MKKSCVMKLSTYITRNRRNTRECVTLNMEYETFKVQFSFSITCTFYSVNLRKFYPTKNENQTLPISEDFALKLKF